MNPKIAIIYTHFPHYRAPVFDALSKSDDYAFEFHYDPGGIEDTIESGDLKDKHYEMPVRRMGPFFWQKGSIALAGSTDLDGLIFLGNPLIISTWIAVLNARLRGKKTFFWTHGWLTRETGAKGMLRRAFYKLSDGLMVYGERAREIGIASGFDAANIHVISNSLDYERQRALREELSTIQGAIASANPDAELFHTPFFLSVTRLIPSVKLELAIKAMSDLPEEATLVIVGEGPWRTMLENLVAKLEVNVVFLGAIYDERRLAALYLNSLAVVSPGKVGLLAMHALAYGTPVITHDNFDEQMPEVEAIIPGTTGALFSQNSILELTNAMRLYFNMPLDAPERNICRAKAIARIERDFTPTVQCERITDALNSKFRGGA